MRCKGIVFGQFHRYPVGGFGGEALVLVNGGQFREFLFRLFGLLRLAQGY